VAQSKQIPFMTSLGPSLSGSPENTMSSIVAMLGSRGGDGIPESMAGLSKQVEALVSVSQTQSTVTESNTQAVLQNTVIQASGVKGALGGVGQAAGRILTSGLGLMSIASAIGKLFGGHTQEEPPPLVRFDLPPSQQFEMASVPDGISRMDYGIGGEVRPIRAQESPTPATSATRMTESPTQITVQVQAMDSRSFMDHSGEIARAVREAMLSMHPLNDVVNDL
jgi:hypothetical protein